MERNSISGLHLPMLMILLTCITSRNAADQSDLSCLRSIKQSLEDPSGTLADWDFNKTYEGFMCGFTGVECWNDMNMVFSINLVDSRLRGPFPIGIRNCTNIGYLSLSNNYLSGPIPSDLGDALLYMVHLDLSNNSLSGPIPPSIVNCRYINSLRLQNNLLTGQIPKDLTALYRIVVFNVSNNILSGPVPIFRSGYNVSAESYANNSGLCGGPLKACKYEDHDDLFLSGFAVGFPLFTILSMLFMFIYFP